VFIPADQSCPTSVVFLQVGQIMYTFRDCARHDFCICHLTLGEQSRINKEEKKSKFSIFYFLGNFISRTEMNTHTQGQERPELTPPQCDPPATPSPALLPSCSTRRSSRHMEYALTSLPIILFSTSFEISVIIIHFLMTPYSSKSRKCAIF
jgi:hypothetical protein